MQSEDKVTYSWHCVGEKDSEGNVLFYTANQAGPVLEFKNPFIVNRPRMIKPTGKSKKVALEIGGGETLIGLWGKQAFPVLWASRERQKRATVRIDVIHFGSTSKQPSKKKASRETRPGKMGKRVPVPVRS